MKKIEKKLRKKENEKKKKNKKKEKERKKHMDNHPAFIFYLSQESVKKNTKRVRVNVSSLGLVMLLCTCI